MAKAVLIGKARKWKKAAKLIDALQDNHFSEEECKLFAAVNQWVAHAGYNEIDNEALSSYLSIMEDSNKDRMQSDFTSSVNQYVSILKGLADRYSRDKNVWYDFYDEVKDFVGEPIDNTRSATAATVPGVSPSGTPASPSSTRTPVPGASASGSSAATAATVPGASPSGSRAYPSGSHASPRPAFPSGSRVIIPESLASGSIHATTPRVRPERKKEHFSFRMFFYFLMTYGGASLLGILPFALGRLGVYLWDDYWFWSLVSWFAAIGSIAVAWYGWIAWAIVLVPVWICTTSWWWLGALILLFELWFVYGCCQAADDDD